MIAFVRGTVAEKTAASVVVDVGGVGYRCGVSTTTASRLPAPGSGEECLVYTHLQVRDDGVSLFGFHSADERSVFEKLVAITGVGPKLALSVLSSFSPNDLRLVVASGDEKRMATVPGVGKKTASRMILELKDAFKDLPASVGAASGLLDLEGAQAPSADASQEAVDALLSMGFSSAEASLALKGFEGDASDVSAALKYALRRLGSGV